METLCDMLLFEMLFMVGIQDGSHCGIRIMAGLNFLDCMSE